MKKLLSLFVVAALTLGGLTSCAKQEEKNDSGKKPVKSTAAGKSEPAKAEKTTITVWHSADASIADTLEKKLNSLLKNTKVKLERKENLSDSLKLVSNDPKSAPDMFLWAHDKVGVFAEMGIIEPVNKLISDEQMKDLIPMTLAAGTYKKEKYQLPLYFESLLFIYNKDLMKNPPKTTDELLAAAKAETKDNKYVFVEQHSTSYCIAPWLHGFGGYMINSEKKPGLNLPETQKALEYHKQFVKYMPADGEYNTVTTLFTEGKSASIIGGPWLIPGLKAAKLNYGIAPMPKLPNGEPLKPFSGVQGLQVVKQAAENKTAAVKEVLAAAINPEVGIALAKVANCAPANSQAYKDAEVGKNEMISTLREMAKTLVPMPNIPEMDVMWGATDGLLAEINKNGKDVAGSCEKYQKQATEQIANMK
jgi:hypothetical protein